MVATAVAAGHDSLFVSAPATELIGISGRAVGVLDREAKVQVHGERGPYTIVTYEGRNGYVLTAHLTSRTSLENALTPDAPSGDETPKPRRWAGIWLRALIPLAAAGSAAAAVLALV